MLIVFLLTGTPSVSEGLASVTICSNDEDIAKALAAWGQLGAALKYSRQQQQEQQQQQGGESKVLEEDVLAMLQGLQAPPAAATAVAAAGGGKAATAARGGGGGGGGGKAVTAGGGGGKAAAAGGGGDKAAGSALGKRGRTDTAGQLPKQGLGGRAAAEATRDGEVVEPPAKRAAVASSVGVSGEGKGGSTAAVAGGAREAVADAGGAAAAGARSGMKRTLGGQGKHTKGRGTPTSPLGGRLEKLWGRVQSSGPVKQQQQHPQQQTQQLSQEQMQRQQTQQPLQEQLQQEQHQKQPQQQQEVDQQSLIGSGAGDQHCELQQQGGLRGGGEQGQTVGGHGEQHGEQRQQQQLQGQGQQEQDAGNRKSGVPDDDEGGTGPAKRPRLEPSAPAVAAVAAGSLAAAAVAALGGGGGRAAGDDSRRGTGGGGGSGSGDGGGGDGGGTWQNEIGGDGRGGGGGGRAGGGGGRGWGGGGAGGGGGGGGWSQALVQAAQDPEAARATQSIFHVDEQVVGLVDKFPKARKHVLFVAREEGLDRVGQLGQQHLPLLLHMRELALRWIGEQQQQGQVQQQQQGQISQQEQQQQQGRQPIPKGWQLGFHAIPSMFQLHLHVVSRDFDSPCLKHKKHWNSFTTGFFKNLDDVLGELQQSGRVVVDVGEAEKLLKQPLKCHVCGVEQANMPKLKLHILQHTKHLA